MDIFFSKDNSPCYFRPVRYVFDPSVTFSTRPLRFRLVRYFFDPSVTLDAGRRKFLIVTVTEAGLS
jgi:hypothetical protein